MPLAINRRRTLCALSLGSNKPYENLFPVEIVRAAAFELHKTLTEVKCSPLYKTSPVGKSDQKSFINAVVTGFFLAPPHELLLIINRIEARYGRNRSVEKRWGERSLDIDILLYGEFVIETETLTIPHPRLKERAFALRPLLDLLPAACEPGTGIPYQKLLAALPPQGIQPL